MNPSIVLLAASIIGALIEFAPSRDIGQVAWMAGCWESKNGRRLVQENWMPPAGNTAVGTGRTVRGDSLVDYELMVIRAAGERLVFEAHPMGQSPAHFSSIVVSPDSVVFENKAHDFPQQIGYHRKGADSLIAWVSGPSNGTTRKIEFPYGRVRCTGAT